MKQTIGGDWEDNSGNVDVWAQRNFFTKPVILILPLIHFSYSFLSSFTHPYPTHPHQVGGLMPAVSPTSTVFTTMLATTYGNSTASSGTTSEAQATPCAPPPWWSVHMTSDNTPGMAHFQHPPNCRPENVKHLIAPLSGWCNSTQPSCIHPDCWMRQMVMRLFLQKLIVPHRACSQPGPTNGSAYHSSPLMMQDWFYRLLNDVNA